MEKARVLSLTVEEADSKDPVFRKSNRRWFWYTMPVVGWVLARFFGKGYIAIQTKND